MDSYHIRDHVEDYMQKLRLGAQRIKDTAPEQLEKYYEKRALVYEAEMEQYRKGYERIAELLPNNLDSLLDVGCGTGLELEEIFKRFPECYVTGVDISREMLDRLEEKYFKKNIELVRADCFKRLYPKHNYEAVLSAFTMHHYDWKKKRYFYEKLFSALKPEGKIILMDTFACCEEEENLMAEAADYVRQKWDLKDSLVHLDVPITPDKEIGALRLAGFENVRVEGICDGVMIIVGEKQDFYE